MGYFYYLRKNFVFYIGRRVYFAMGESNDNSVEQGSYGRTVKYLGIFGGAQGVSMLLNLLRNKVASVLLGVSGLSVIAIFNRTIQMFSDCTGLSLAFSAIRTMNI